MEVALPDKDRTWKFRLFASLALALVAAATAVAQSGGTAKPSQEPQQPPMFRTEANFVRVDVYPTQAGKPVLDLRAEDFEVLEDGEAQSIQRSNTSSSARPVRSRSDRSPTPSAPCSRRPPTRATAFSCSFSTVPRLGRGGMARPRAAHPADRPRARSRRSRRRHDAEDVRLGRRARAKDRGDRRRACATSGPGGSATRSSEMSRSDLYEPAIRMPEQRDVVAKMIERRRERLTLDSLNELVLYLRDIRQERKAILTVSEGWLLYRPDSGLTELRTDPISGKTEPIPGPDPISVGPDGRTHDADHSEFPAGCSKKECDATQVDAVDDRRREVLPRHHRRSQHGKRVVLYRRSARAGGVRHADRPRAGRRRSRSMPACCGTGSVTSGRWPMRPTASR